MPCGASYSGDRCPQIRSGLLLEACTKKWRVVDHSAIKKTFENFPAFGPLNHLGHPAVFRLDLRIVFGKTRWLGAQDGEVDVHQQLLIRISRFGGVAGRHDQRSHPPDLRFPCSASRQFAGGPVGTALLVVFGLQPVNRVVKPEGNFNVSGVNRKVERAFQLGDALTQMLQRVVAAMGWKCARQLTMSN